MGHFMRIRRNEISSFIYLLFIAYSLTFLGCFSQLQQSYIYSYKFTITVIEKVTVTLAVIVIYRWSILILKSYKTVEILYFSVYLFGDFRICNQLMKLNHLLIVL